MMKSNSVSVCVATYNGEKYISEQLDSILKQLSGEDEIVVSDDGSSDDTTSIVKKYIKMNNNIKLVEGPREGFSKNFENAISYSENAIIVFSDQDDIWKDNKIKIIKDSFDKQPNITTVLHNMSTFRNNQLEDTKEIKLVYKSGVFKNFVKSSYWGCCMAVRREFVNEFMPFRHYCVGHDQLIGLLSEKYGETIFLDEDLIWHRLHDLNTSNRRTIRQMIEFRKELFKDYMRAKRVFECNAKD